MLKGLCRRGIHKLYSMGLHDYDAGFTQSIFEYALRNILTKNKNAAQKWGKNVRQEKKQGRKK